MKKQILFALLLTFTFAVTRAQGPYTSAEYGVAGDSLFYTSVNVDTSTLNFAQAGANINWNFSTLAPTTQFYNDYLNPATAGYKATFLAECTAGGGTGCNAQFNALTNLAFRDQNNINIQGTVLTDVIVNDFKGANSLETNILGFTVTINGVGIRFTAKYNTPDVVYVFPINYGNRDSSVSSYDINLTAHGYNFIYHVHNKRVNYADAYGTLVTPYATYNSTVRHRSYVLHTDTLDYNGTVIPVTPYTSVEYDWFNAGYIGPVFTASGTLAANGHIAFTNVTYLDTIHCLQPVAREHHIPEPPVINPSAGNVTVNFTNASTNANTYFWNFDNPSSGVLNTSTLTNPTHVYDSAAVYRVELVACNTACQPEKCDTLFFNVNVIDSGTVRALFFVTPTQGCIEDTVHFTNNSTNSNSWFWNFGDQNTSTLKNPTHIYTLPGSYTVTLIASNGITSDTTTRVITINAQASALITAGGPTTFCNGDSVTLAASGGTVYHWSTGHLGATIKVKASGTYTVTATNSCGSATASQVVTVNTPRDTVIALGDTSICTGDSVGLSVSTTVGATYQWRRDGQIIVGATTNIYYAKTSGNYRANVISNSCEGVSNTIRVVAGAAPTASISTQSSTIVCSGDSLKITAVNVAGATYQWQNGGQAIAGATARIYYAKTSGTYTVAVARGACTSTSNSIIVTGVTTPQPVLAPNGTATTCSGDSVFLTTATVNGYTYQWLLNSNPIAGATNNFYSVQASGSYTVAATLNGCTGTSAATVVTVNPSPVASAGSAQSLTGCSFSSITIGGSPTASGGTSPYTYAWSPVAGLNDSVAANPTVSQIGSTTTYNILVTDSKGCTATSSVLITVTGSSLSVSATVTGDSVWCAGTPGSVTFTAVPNGGTAPYIYNWSPGTDLSSTNTAATTANPAAVGVYNYNVLVIDHNGCQAGTSVSVNVEALPNATVSTLDTIAPCTGDTVHFVAAPGNGYTYQWYNGITAVTGATGPDFDVVNPGTYSVSVTSGVCNATSAPVTVTNRPQPVASIVAHGGPSFCYGGNDLLIAGSGTGYDYQWYQDGYGIAGATAGSYLATDSGAYYAVVTLNGCSLQSNSVGISILPYPTDSVSVSGPVTFCTGDSVILNVTTTPGDLYQWVNNGNYIPGANDSAITVSASGNYNVIVSLAGCASTSTEVPVTVYQYPMANLTISGNLTFCGGDSVTLTATDSSDFNYQWFNLVGGNIDSLPGITPSITVGDSGSYYVVITENICATTSSSVYANEIALPVAGAFLTADGFICPGSTDTISANVMAGYTYQWQKDGSNIPGATGPTYAATDSGTYTVVETGFNNCSAVSNYAIVSYDSCTAGIPTITDNESISVYPNPAHDAAVVTLTTSRAGKMDINMFDVLGNQVSVVYEGKTFAGSNVYNIPMSTLAPGLYMLRFYDGTAVVTRKIVKE